MSRKSGNRFSEKDMRQQRDLEYFPIPLNWENALGGGLLAATFIPAAWRAAMAAGAWSEDY
jgi:hypothetical protein